jgi:hypothetical protein
MKPTNLLCSLAVPIHRTFGYLTLSEAISISNIVRTWILTYYVNLDRRNIGLNIAELCALHAPDTTNALDMMGLELILSSNACFGIIDG